MDTDSGHMHAIEWFSPAKGQDPATGPAVGEPMGKIVHDLTHTWNSKIPNIAIGKKQWLPRAGVGSTQGDTGQMLQSRVTCVMDEYRDEEVRSTGNQVEHM